MFCFYHCNLKLQISFGFESKQQKWRTLSWGALGRQVAELRRNAYNADVTLTCQGEVILAHSFILGMRFVLMYCEFIFKEDP